MKFEFGKYCERELKDASPLALSFVGDAVHTLFIRKEMFGREKYDNNKLHVLSSEECRATAQAKAAAVLAPQLTDDELFIFKKGKNAKVNSIPKNASQIEYKTATALEALIGYLFLAGKEERLNEIFNILYGETGSENE